MKSKRNVLIVALVLLLLGSGQAAACWCDQTRQENFDYSDAVFAGIVTHRELGNWFGNTRYDLTVTACWKGVSEEGSAVTVWADSWSSCSWAQAEVGEEWVIYATFSESNGFYTDQCYYNAQVPLPPDHAAFLGPSNCAPVAVEAETWGRIKSTYR